MNLKTVSWLLLIVGGVNWGLVGLGGFFGGDWNVVYMIFSPWPVVESLVYVLVGASAVYQFVNNKKGSSGGMM